MYFVSNNSRVASCENKEKHGRVIQVALEVFLVGSVWAGDGRRSSLMSRVITLSLLGMLKDIAENQ
jgi:hypothetical protein